MQNSSAACFDPIVMRKWNKLSSRPWGGSCICRTFLRNASARCALCRDESFPNLHTASLYRDSRWLSRRSSDSAVLNLAESERVSMCTALSRRSGTLPNRSVFEPDEFQPCRITLHVSDVKVASTGAFYLRLPNQPNQESLHACRIRNCDTTLRYAKVE